MSLANLVNESSLKIAGAVILPNVGGFLNGYFVTKPNIANGWYGSLKKPAYNPPNWLFGPAWTSIYSAMGYASYLVWQEGQKRSTEVLPQVWMGALAVYGAQLAVNQAWSPIFFTMHDLKRSFYVILGLDALVVLNAVAFYRVKPEAGLLLAPYLAWLSYASYLNYSVWQLNKDKNTDAAAVEQKNK